MEVRKIRVLIVDGSDLVRKILTDILTSEPDIEVIAAVGDPYHAANKIKHELPDIIALDAEMLNKDMLTFLQAIMSQKPLNVIILSSLTERASETTLKALEIGAIDVVKKPTVTTLRNYDDDLRIQMIELIKTTINVKANKIIRQRNTELIKGNSEILPKVQMAPSSSMINTTEKVVVIGASTGGTEAIKNILINLPYDSPAIVIVQHLPEVLTKAFADRLNEMCEITVKEAGNRDSILRGQALIAPGNMHTTVRRSGAKYYVEVMNGDQVNSHRPSVDVLFESAATFLGENCLGILLTGKGKDGAKGLLSLKNAGAITVAQDENTSVVFDMPKEAIRLGAAQKVLPLEDMTPAIIDLDYVMAK